MRVSASACGSTSFSDFLSFAIALIPYVTSPPAITMLWPVTLSVPGLHSHITVWATSSRLDQPALRIGGDQRCAAPRCRCGRSWL